MTIKNIHKYKKIARESLYLCRYHYPVPILIIYMSSLHGVLVASILNTEYTPRLVHFLFFFLATAIGRSFGCIVNDICDRKIDRLVERTKNRPLAIHSVDIKTVIVLLCIHIICGGILFSMLSSRAKIAFVCIVPFILIYPLTKRFFFAPQLFLGIVINSGFFVALFHILPQEISVARLSLILVYLGHILWTVGYDTAYAYMDYHYDKKLNLFSLAITFEKRINNFLILVFLTQHLLWLSFFFYHLFNTSILILTAATLPLVLSFTITAIVIYRSSLTKKENCMKVFELSLFHGLFFFISLYVTLLSS